jgi:heat shock protein HtpX
MTKWKAFFLLALLTVLLVYFGKILGGTYGMTLALIFAGFINFISYWFSDKIVLAMYRAKPVSHAEAPRLHEIVGELAQRAHIPKPKIYLIPTDHPNAFATGRNPNNASVAVTKGILRILNERELKGVLAHEISHVRNYDILIGTIAATLAGAITYLAQIFRFSLFFGGMGDDEDRGGGNLLFALLVSILAPLAALLVQLAISRSREYLADETAAKITRDPLGLANALEKIAYGAKKIPLEANPATSHLFIVAPLKGEGIYSLFSTHPPIEERIRRLKEMSLRGVSL